MKHKVLSVKQPWSFLICVGIKPIENRTWKCPQKYIGERVLIHASKSTTKYCRHNYSMFTESQLNEIKQAKCERGLRQLCLNGHYNPKYMCIGNDISSYSAIIGSVEIVDCVLNHPSIWAEKSNPISFDEYGYPLEYEKKIYNWVVADPILFEEPILNVKGKLGFWNYDLPEEYETILKL